MDHKNNLILEFHFLVIMQMIKESYPQLLFLRLDIL